MTEVMEGRAAAAQIAGLLVGLAMKGERPIELVGLARAMRARAVPLTTRYERVFDTCGTGGDRAGTFNISSCAAIVVAACGVRVAKHGNRSVSSQSGSADVFEALGVRVSAAPADVERCLAEAEDRILLCPDISSVDAPRRADAARSRDQIGVQPARPADESRRCDAAAGRRAEAGTDGAAGPGPFAAWIGTRVGRARRRRHRRDFDDGLHENFGRARRLCEHLLRASGRHRVAEGRSRARSRAVRRATTRRILERVLAGESGPARDVVLLNAGAALFIAGAAASIQDGLMQAAAAIDRGEARRTLDRLIAVSTAAPLRAGRSA